MNTNYRWFVLALIATSSPAAQGAWYMKFDGIEAKIVTNNDQIPNPGHTYENTIEIHDWS